MFWIKVIHRLRANKADRTMAKMMRSRNTNRLRHERCRQCASKGAAFAQMDTIDFILKNFQSRLAMGADASAEPAYQQLIRILDSGEVSEPPPHLYILC